MDKESILTDLILPTNPSFCAPRSIDGLQAELDVLSEGFSSGETPPLKRDPIPNLLEHGTNLDPAPRVFANITPAKIDGRTRAIHLTSELQRQARTLCSSYPTGRSTCGSETLAKGASASQDHSEEAVETILSDAGDSTVTHLLDNSSENHALPFRLAMDNVASDIERPHRVTLPISPLAIRSPVGTIELDLPSPNSDHSSKSGAESSSRESEEASIYSGAWQRSGPSPLAVVTVSYLIFVASLLGFIYRLANDERVTVSWVLWVAGWAIYLIASIVASIKRLH